MIIYGGLCEIQGQEEKTFPVRLLFIEHLAMS
jgi:hypothetical protein